MGKIKDITGQKFNMLTAIEFIRSEKELVLCGNSGAIVEMKLKNSWGVLSLATQNLAVV